MHTEAWLFVANAIGRLSPNQRVVDIGGRDINGSVRRLFNTNKYTSVDIADGPGVDVVADGATYSPESPVDIVVCVEVLEHASDPRMICENARRMLRPGGLFIVTAASPERPPHGCLGGPVGNEHYAGVSITDLADWLSWAEHATIEHHARRGDVYATAVRGEA